MSLNIKKCLIIDDDEDYRNLLDVKLKRSIPDISIEHVDPRSDEMPDELYNWNDIDFIILDYNLGINYTGLDWFKRFNPDELPPTILLTARGNEELAVTAIKLGLDDYLVKEHFDSEKLTEAIKEIVANKRNKIIKLGKIKGKEDVFNKASFIKRLRLIKEKKDSNNILFLLSPSSYQQIGRQHGISHQDNYIKLISEKVHDYLKSKNISHNIFIYKEEYIAVIIETNSYNELLDHLCIQLQEEAYPIAKTTYPCTVDVGVITSKDLDEKEFDKSDFELLSSALVLCNTAKANAHRQVYRYGEELINIKDKAAGLDKHQYTKILQSFNIEDAVQDGRVSANYQPWAYIGSADGKETNEIYDIRVEFIDTKGNILSQNILVKLLDNDKAKLMVDRWVLRNIARLSGDLNKTKGISNFKLAVKITLSTITQPDFMAWLRKLLADSNVPNDHMLIEVDANQLVRKPGAYKTLFDTIGIEYRIKFILSGIHDIDIYYKTRDIHVFDYVKLNVNEMIDSFDRNAITELVRNIKSDKANIVAINISDAEKLALVSEFDLDYLHGYLIGKPSTEVILGTASEQNSIV